MFISRCIKMIFSGNFFDIECYHYFYKVSAINSKLIIQLVSVIIKGHYASVTLMAVIDPPVYMCDKYFQMEVAVLIYTVYTIRHRTILIIGEYLFRNIISKSIHMLCAGFDNVILCEFAHWFYIHMHKFLTLLLIISLSNIYANLFLFTMQSYSY